MWKARWALLRDMHVNFTFDDQVQIVLASMAMHNYIRKAGRYDEAFGRAQQDTYTPAENRRLNTNGTQQAERSTGPARNPDSLWMAAYRDMLTEDIMNSLR